MDWKYKRFQQDRVFPAPRDLVVEAARTFLSDSLGWQVTDTTGGLTAQGDSFGHRAIANCVFQSTSDGIRVSVELLVERAGATGFMLFDVGGYYRIQVRKWLEAIQWRLHQEQSSGQDVSPNPPVAAQNKTTARLFNGCLVFIVVMFALWFVVTLISALAGLLTGTLYLWGRGGALVVHGIWARIIAAVILLFGAWIGWRIRAQRRHHSPSGI